MFSHNWLDCATQRIIHRDSPGGAPQNRASGVEVCYRRLPRLSNWSHEFRVPASAVALLVGGQEQHPACKRTGSNYAYKFSFWRLAPTSSSYRKDGSLNELCGIVTVTTVILPTQPYT